jgi:hypothetical protein
MSEMGEIKRRDVRLDFFRGLALIFIFLNHIPNNAASWISSRNWGLSDATEIFVFVSGYSAFLAYSGVMERKGLLFTAARILRRVWKIYIAHIFLFIVFSAHIAYIAHRYANPLFAEEMNIVGFLSEPHIALFEALLLRFRPANMDILPLYIVLLGGFPFALWLLRKAPLPTLGLSLALYFAANLGNINFSAYPSGGWFFNPLAWQFLFLLGAWCGSLHKKEGPWRKIPPRLFVPLATAILLFGLWLAMSWQFAKLGRTVPPWLGRLIYPIDKTNLDILRLLHFLALAYVTVLLVKADAKFLAWRVWRPLILCGHHSLHIFCVGIVLSFFAHVVLVEIHETLVMQFVVSLVGTAIMMIVARLLDWYKFVDDAPESAASPPPPSMAGRP